MLLLCVLGATGLACASDTGPPPAQPAAAARLVALENALARSWTPLPAGALRVRLAFDERADLDLFVTDPLQETVYYANTPSASGGALAEDRGCLAAAPRIESVAFAKPPPGRYRVGVDFPERCTGGDDAVLFYVVVESAGRREIRPGRIELGVFEPIVLEFDFVPAAPEPGAPPALGPLPPLPLIPADPETNARSQRRARGDRC